MESGADWIPSQAEWEAIGSAMTEYPDLFDELGFDMRGIPDAEPQMVSQEIQSMSVYDPAAYRVLQQAAEINGGSLDPQTWADTLDQIADEQAKK
ncbi:hypothetical protein [Bifidobacterium breve]|uniref:hypothetical protein n=1 Tax=Bifidobacterium breve TaxID=1685 RepID=UPI00254E6C98|nr:hypothetical protein [Bifidobacterium breve]MDK8732446.1 hypothetical protein [Bifidobacterium breve]MDU1289090.1 hypothetical protein [Bifidobacterium bifidum]